MACASPISQDTEWGPIKVRCKQCLPCRIQKQSSLTLRCLLENRSAFAGWFVTLTYEEPPEEPGYRDMQKFLNRLRSAERRAGNPLPIRFLACGEFGERSGRFHYHALLWNAQSLERANYLSQLWPQGFVHIGQVTPQSIRYTVRYTLKFQKKGLEVHAGWSRSPPLGENSMKALGERALKQGHVFIEPPTSLSVDGRTYPVDSAMQIAFAQAYNPSWIKVGARGTKKLARSPVAAVLEHRETMINGDELLEVRERNNRRAEWWQNVRKHNGYF